MNVYSRTGLLRPMQPPGLIDLHDRAPWQGLNDRPFAFNHRLAGHPLFALERLAELSERLFDRPDFGRYVKASELSRPKAELKREMRDNILGVAERGGWLAMHYVDEIHPDYAELYEQLLADIEALTDVPVRRRMAWGSMSVFINGPGLNVPYHFDHETNFLMQIQGEKELRLYPRGLATLTLDEIEDFYRNNPMAGRFRPELADGGELFILKPGVAVHHPPLAPHMIRNRQDVSVSVAVYYVTPEMEDFGRVHQMNFCMRRLGLRPRPVGSSVVSDRIKSAIMRSVSMSRPRTHEEMLYSGIKRLRAPLQFTKSVVHRARQGLGAWRGRAA